MNNLSYVGVWVSYTTPSGLRPATLTTPAKWSRVRSFSEEVHGLPQVKSRYSTYLLFTIVISYVKILNIEIRASC